MPLCRPTYSYFLLTTGTQIEDNFLLYIEVKSQDEIIHPSIHPNELVSRLTADINSILHLTAGL